MKLKSKTYGITNPDGEQLERCTLFKINIFIKKTNIFSKKTYYYSFHRIALYKSEFYTSMTTGTYWKVINYQRGVGGLT